MKKLLFLILMAMSSVMVAQTGLHTNVFTTTGRDPSLNGSVPLTGTGIGYQKITWTTSGTVSTCSVQLDSSTDGSSWIAAGAIASQTCTSAGQTAITPGVFNFVAINVTALSGGGTITVTWNGYTSSGGALPTSTISFPVGAGVVIQQTGTGFPGPGLYWCNQSTTCTTAQQLTQLNGTLVSGTTSPSAILYTTGSSLWRGQGVLGANNLNNINNLCTHKELSTPTVSNITADVGGTGSGQHFQPIESCVIFPNVNGPGDVIYITFKILCSGTTCASNANTFIQVRLSDPTTSCTVTSATLTIGGLNQVWLATAEIVTNGSTNGGTANLDLIMDRTGGGSTFSGDQKTSTCAINMGGGYAIAVDILLATNNAAVIDTWIPYMVENWTSF